MRIFLAGTSRAIPSPGDRVEKFVAQLTSKVEEDSITASSYNHLHDSLECYFVILELQLLLASGLLHFRPWC